MGGGASKAPVPPAQTNDDRTASLLDGKDEHYAEPPEKPQPFNPAAGAPAATAPTVQPAYMTPPPARPIPESPQKRDGDDIDALKAQAQYAYNPNASMPPPPQVPGKGREFCAQCGTEHMTGDRANFCFNCGHPTNLLTPQTSVGVPPPPSVPPADYEQAGAPMPQITPPAHVPAPLSNSGGAQAPRQQPGTFVVSLPAEVKAGDVMKVPVPPPFPQQGQLARFRVPESIPHNRLVYVPLPTGAPMPDNIPRGMVLDAGPMK